MSIQPQTLSKPENQAIVSICILAAFADGAQDEIERGQIERIVNGFSEEHLDLASAYQDVLPANSLFPKSQANCKRPRPNRWHMKWRFVCAMLTGF